MTQLKVFHEKWQAHYNNLLDKYPDDEGLRAVEKFNAAMNDIFSGGTAAVKGNRKTVRGRKEPAGDCKRRLGGKEKAGKNAGGGQRVGQRVFV